MLCLRSQMWQIRLINASKCGVDCLWRCSDHLRAFVLDELRVEMSVFRHSLSCFSLSP